MRKEGIEVIPADGLVLLSEDCCVGFSVGIEAILLAALPSGSVFGVGDIPVGATFFCDNAEVLAKVFEGWAAPEPVAVVDLEDDEAGFEDDGVGNHRIMDRVGVFGDVEILLDASACIGEECPVSADTGAEFIGFGDGVGANGNEAAVAYLHLAVELDEQLCLAAIFRAKAAAA